MAQFSNGTEGMSYEETWCRRCVHDGKCAIIAAHQIYRHKGEVGEVLDMMIPVDDKGYNQECRLFLEKNKPNVCDGSPLFDPIKE